MYNILFEIVSKTVIPRSTKQLPSQEIDYLVQSQFLDSLLLNDKISFIVNGPNLDIVALFRWFGKDTVERLLEDKIIEFIYAPGVFTYLTRGNVESLKLSSNPGLTLLSALDPAWNSIFDSTYSALKEQTEYPRSYRRHISRLVEKTSVPFSMDEIRDNVYESSQFDVRNEIGKEFGFDKYANPDDGTIAQDMISYYLDIAHSNNILFLSAKNNCTTILGNENTNNILNLKVQCISSKLDSTIKNYQYIKNFEDFPDILPLLKSGSLKFNKLLKLRDSKDGENFKNWIHNMQSGNEIDVIKEFTKNIFNRNSDLLSSKILRIVFNTGVGALLLPLNPIAGLAAGVGLNLLDTFLVEKLINKWEPKFFINKIKKVSTSS